MDPETIEFTTRVTLADQLAMTLLIIDRPAIRRARFLGRLLVVLIYPAVGLWIGFSIGWLASGPAPYLQAMAHLLSSDAVPLLKLYAAAAAIAALLFTLQHLTRSPRLRSRLARLLRERPGIDPADPTLAEAVTGSLGPAGFTSIGVASRTELGWPSLHALDETPGLFVLRTGTISAFAIPKRDLTAAQTEAIRRMFNTHRNERPPGKA